MLGGFLSSCYSESGVKHGEPWLDCNGNFTCGAYGCLFCVQIDNGNEIEMGNEMRTNIIR